MPSPQSTSMRSPPRRTSVPESPRRAVGTEPDVPRKIKIEIHGRSLGAVSLDPAFRPRRLGLHAHDGTRRVFGCSDAADRAADMLRR